jgi:hypothetical protein
VQQLQALYLQSRVLRSLQRSGDAAAVLGEFIALASDTEPNLVPAIYERLVLECKNGPPPEKQSPEAAQLLLSRITAQSARAQVSPPFSAIPTSYYNTLKQIEAALAHQPPQEVAAKAVVEKLEKVCEPFYFCEDFHSSPALRCSSDDWHSLSCFAQPRPSVSILIWSN